MAINVREASYKLLHDRLNRCSELLPAEPTDGVILDWCKLAELFELRAIVTRYRAGNVTKDDVARFTEICQASQRHARSGDTAALRAPPGTPDHSYIA